MNSAKTTNILNIHFGECKIVKEECYPLLAYINNSGNPNGVMFNSFLFDFSKGETLEDWETQIKALFNIENGIRALDFAAADVKGLLDLPKDKTIDIYIKAPIPKVSLKPFGDINRDGVIEKLLDLDDCLNAFSLFVSDLLRNFNIASLENLTIKGWVLDINGKDDIRTACTNHLNEKGFAVYGAEIKNIELTTSTDFSELACENAKLRVFSSQTADFLLNCAFSQKNEYRNVYDSLYILLNPERFFEPAVELQPPTVAEEAQTEEKIHIDEDISDEEMDEIIEKIIDEMPELEQPVQPETQPEREEVKDEIEIEISQKASTEPEKGKISVEISITEEAIPDEEEKKAEASVPCKLTDKQKRTLLGAGIAAAAMGVAYLISKAKKEL